MSGNRRCPVPPAPPAGTAATAALVPAAVLLGLAATYYGASSNAAEWLAEGQASLTGKFDDNIRLSATNKQSVFGAIFAPQFSVRGRSQIWDLNFIADASIAQYSEDSALNSEDPRLRFDARYLTMKGQIRLEGEASRTSTLVTEETDAGRFDTNTARNLFRLSPTWSYSLTELDTLHLGAGWTEAFYESDDLADYRSLNANAGWSRQVTEADVVSLSVVADHFESDSAVDLQSNSVAALVGWEHSLSERLKVSVAAGPQYFTTDVPVFVGGTLQTEERDSFGYRVNASIDYQLSQQTSVGASFAHQIDPSGSGSPLQRDRFEAHARHQFLPRLSASLSAYFQQDSSPTDEPGSDRDRDYVSVEPRLIYELTPTWDLSGSYRFRTQDTDNADRVFSNAFFVTVTYKPMQWTLGH